MKEDHVAFICEDDRSQVILSTQPAGTFVQLTSAGQAPGKTPGRQLNNLRRRENGFQAEVDGVPIHTERLRKLGFHEHLAWGKLSCWR